jgi:hypothetical protein
MLFGFDRPAMAGSLYREAAVDTAADSLMAARAFYGLWIVQGQRLGNADSANVVAAQLQERYPESAQARELRADGGGNLVEFLLAERSVVQQRNLANLPDAERAALEEITVPTGSSAGESATRGPRARRRMVYFARRDNLVYPPPEIVIPLGERPGPGAGMSRSAALPPTDAGQGAPPGEVGATASPAGVGADGAVLDPAAAAAAATDTTGTAVAPEAAAKPAEAEKPKKKERDPNWDQLREPYPGPRP